MPLTDDQILWDIEAEHLDEGEFVFGMREVTLDAPHYTLSELEDHYERRVFVHVDALAVAGPRVADRLLLPTLEDPNEYADKIAIATLAIHAISAAQSDSSQLGSRALAVLDTAHDDQRAGIVRALALVEDPQLDGQLIQAVTGTAGLATAARLDLLARRQVAVGDWLREFLRSEDPGVALAAARLARHCTSRGALEVLGSLAEAAEPELRRTTLETALCREVEGSWQLAVYWAFCPGESPFRRDALTWVALLGDAAVHQRILAMLDEPELRVDALWAVGFAGRMSAVDRCVELLDDEKLGPLAGEVIASIAGLPSEDDRYHQVRPAAEQDHNLALPVFEHDKLDAELGLDPADMLPIPDPEAIAAWWRGHRHDYEPALRYLGGQPLTAGVLVDGLRNGPMRRRHVLALELAMRTSGAAVVNTRALCRDQRAQLDALAGISAIDFQRGLAMA